MKPKISVQTQNLDGGAMVRCYLPYNRLHREGRIELLSKWEVYKAQAVVYHRFWGLDTLESIRDVRRRGGYTIVDFDDDLFNVPKANPASPRYRDAELRQVIRWILQEADCVTVSTQHLIKRLKEEAPRARRLELLPNGLEFEEIWTPVEPRLHDGPVVIGYAGSPSHIGDFEGLRGAFKQLKKDFGDQIRFVFMGMRPAFLTQELGDQYDFVDWTDTTRYPETLRSLNLDIALAPLELNNFNFGKSNLKWLEYSSLGAAMVASKLGPYKDIPENLAVTVKNKPSDWVKALKSLIENPQLRFDIARASQAYVLENYSVQNTCGRLEALLESAPLPSRPLWQIPFSPVPELPGGVDVVMPIFNSIEHVQTSVAKVLEDLGPSDRLIAVDDASTDPRIQQFLISAGSAEKRLVILRNQENLGYLRSANRGIKEAAGRDVILMNSDIYPMPGLIDRLKTSAYSHPNIGMVSPLTDKGTIASVPSYDDAFELVKLPELSQSPLVWTHTACGYCMYIKRAVLDRFGPLDESYGFGYWEENEISMRIREAFWCAFDPGAFVYHANSASVSSEKKYTESAKNGRKFLARYPEYQFHQTCFYNSNPLHTVRRTMAAKTSDPRPRILYIGHSLHALGGTEKHMKDLSQSLEDRAHVFIAYPNFRAGLLAVNYREIDHSSRTYHAPPWPVTPPAMPRMIEAWNDVLNEVQPQLIHIHHMMHHPLEVMPRMIDTGIPTVVSFHDAFNLCPDPHLYGCPGVKKCDECFPVHFRGAGHPQYQHDRRALFGQALRRAAACIAPSQYMIDTLREIYTGLPIELIPHGIPAVAKKWQPVVRNEFRVGYIGTISFQKGVHTLVKAFQRFAEKHSDVALHLYGGPPPGQEQFLELIVKSDPKIKHFGSYANAQLGQILSEVDVLVISSEVPESFCYTLSEAQSAKVPVIASNIGALPERIHNGFDGLLFAPGNADELVTQLDKAYLDRDLLARMSAAMPEPLSIQHMAERTWSVYERAWSAPRSAPEDATQLRVLPSSY